MELQGLLSVLYRRLGLKAYAAPVLHLPNYCLALEFTTPRIEVFLETSRTEEWK